MPNTSGILSLALPKLNGISSCKKGILLSEVFVLEEKAGRWGCTALQAPDDCEDTARRDCRAADGLRRRPGRVRGRRATDVAERTANI
jgi:hypothetical protein